MAGDQRKWDIPLTPALSPKGEREVFAEDRVSHCGESVTCRESFPLPLGGEG